MGFLIPPHPLTNFEIHKYKIEQRFNSAFSINNLPINIKDGAYVTNLYFDSFGVEHVPEEIKEFVGNKNIKANIFRVQANDSVMCGYFCIEIIDFMLAVKKN